MIISAHESGSMEVMNGVASEKNCKLKKTLSNDVKEMSADVHAITPIVK